MDSENGDNKGAIVEQSADVCRDFLRNVCSRGSSCRYLHPDNVEKKLEKKFCKDFQNSICQRRSCKFIHCSHEDEEYYMENGRLPPNVDVRGSNTRGAPREDVGLCRDFINGKCTRGAKCKFRHQGVGDREYERMRDMREYDEGYYPPNRPGPMDAYRAISRYGRPGGYDRSSYPTQQDPLEDENARLRKRVELLRKQVDDLTSTNEVLLQQNAQLRTGSMI